MADKKGKPPQSHILFWLALCAGATIIAALILVTAPQIDLMASSLFSDPDHQGFPYARHPILLFFNDLVEIIAFWGIISLLTTLLFRSLLGLSTRRLWFVFASAVTGPLLLTNALLKEHWGRARPRDVEFFGGPLDFTPAFYITDQCATNCSFVSGDASLGFFALTLALALPIIRKKWVLCALAFGGLIGFVRMAQGAHFFSDVLFAGFFMSLTALILYVSIIERRWGLADTIGASSRKVLRPLASTIFGKRVCQWRMFLRTKCVWLGLVDRPASATEPLQKQAPHQNSSKNWFWLFFKARPSDLGISDRNDQDK